MAWWDGTPVLRLDPDGSVLWSRFFFGVVDGSGSLFDRGHSIIQTVDGGFAIAGITDISLADVNMFMVIKTDMGGALLWATVATEFGNLGNSILQTPDRGIVAAGHSRILDPW